MLSFIIRATYDVLPSPTNLNLWMGEDPACPVCSMPASLKHILVGCKASLTQGRYTWRHNQVLRCLAAELETRRITINAMPLPTQDKFQQAILFVREVKKQKSNSLLPDARQLRGTSDWEMRTDLDQQLIFPPEIAATNLRPDLVVWSKSCQHAFLIELTVPWEDAMGEAFERKKFRYTDLVAEAAARV